MKTSQPLKVLLIVLTAVVITACQRGGSVEQPVPTQTSETAAAMDARVTSDLTSIAQEILNGKAYRCSMISKDGQEKMEYTVQGKHISMSFDQTGDNARAMRLISDQEVSYMWDPVSKQGTKFVTPETSTTPPTGDYQPAPDFSDTDSLRELEETYTVSCSPTTVSGTEFTPPSDVQFQDMSALMEAFSQR